MKMRMFPGRFHRQHLDLVLHDKGSQLNLKPFDCCAERLSHVLQVDAGERGRVLDKGPVPDGGVEVLHVVAQMHIQLQQ